jgi:hypothetical protein
MQTLYLSRPLENAVDIADWARAQGFVQVLAPDKLHVTVAYSREPIDWDALLPSRDIYEVPPTADRWLEILESGAVALCFQSLELVARWQEIRDLGAAWDYVDYTPHVTFAFKPGDVDFGRIDPYAGPLQFGPEAFSVVREDETLW